MSPKGPLGAFITPGADSAEGLPLGQRGCPGAKGLPEGPHPKIVWGHNLQHNMAPFGALTGGFCMVFHSPTLVFSNSRPPFLEPQVKVWVPEGLGALFAPKKRARKT